MGLADGPSKAPNQATAGDGILSPEQQAELAAAQSALVASIKKIRDPKLRFAAVVSAVKPFADLLLDAAGSYPGAAPFVAGFRQALDRLGNIVKADAADATWTR